MDTWIVSEFANGDVASTYLGIASTIFWNLKQSGQLSQNRLGFATALIFLTCASHHGSHTIHFLLPAAGLAVHPGLALRAGWEWHTAAVDVVTAGVGVWYWSLRKTYGPLMRGAKLFEDMKERQRQALEINDNIVQGLAVAHLALASKDESRSLEAMEATLAKARTIISDLIGEANEETRLAPGELVRTKPAVVLAGGDGSVSRTDARTGG